MGEVEIKNLQGQDTLIIEGRKYSINYEKSDIVINLEATPNWDNDNIITVRGGVDAMKKGLFGIAEATSTSTTDYSFKAVAGAVNLSFGNNLVGGSGDDTLAVNKNWLFNPYDNTILTGGGGGDTFVLRANSGTVKITDYKLAQRDKIVFDDTTGIQSFNQLISKGAFNADGFEITVADSFGDKTTYLIDDVNLSTLTKAFNDGLILF